MSLDRASSGSLAWLPGHSPSIPISQTRLWVRFSPPCLGDKKMRSVYLEMIQKLGFSMDIVALSRVKHALVQCTGRVENADLVDWII